MNEVCAHFEAINGKKNCRIGEPIQQRCGYDCIAYYPDYERTVCEVWSRVMGYHRPVNAFNAGKQQEHRDRKAFREPA
jgi:anaerobic ribonucleoside-triphosphate reductase